MFKRICDLLYLYVLFINFKRVLSIWESFVCWNFILFCKVYKVLKIKIKFGNIKCINIRNVIKVSKSSNSSINS